MKHISCMIIPPLDAVHSFEDNHHLFPQKINNSEECQQESVLKSVEEVPPKYSYVCGNDLESCFDLEKMDDWPYGEDAPSCSVGIESSTDLLEHFTAGQLRQDMEHSGQAISSEYDSASNTCKDMSEGVTNSCLESCSVSEDVAVKGVWTLSGRSSQVGIEDRSKRNFSDENETKITEDSNSAVGKLNNDLDNANASGKDNDATVPS